MSAIRQVVSAMRQIHRVPMSLSAMRQVDPTGGFKELRTPVWRPGVLSPVPAAISPRILADFAHHKKGVARLNHGSYGAVPRPVWESQDKYRRLWLEQPDAWFFGRTHHVSLEAAVEAVARRVNVSPEEVVLVENSTTATTIISQRWARKTQQDGGEVMMLNLSYAASLNNARHYVEYAGGKVRLANVPFPLTSEDEMVDAIRRCKLANPKVRFALVEHVGSQPALRYPIEQIVQMLKALGVEEVAVDGSHALGCVPGLDVGSIGADFYFSNIHKWGMGPSGSTFLHCKPEHLEDTHHPIVSWNWGEKLKGECCYTGSRDYSAMMVIPDAMEYLQDVSKELPNGMSIEDYNHQSTLKYAEMLGKAWGTYLPQPKSTVTSMAMVQLPQGLIVEDAPGQPGGGVRTKLREEYDVEAAVGGFGDRGNFVRLSHQIYNSPSDFERLRDAVLDILKKQ